LEIQIWRYGCLPDGQDLAYFDHDNAGHVWRTNSGGVTKVMQYDVSAHVTATPSNDGSSTNLNLGNNDRLASISSAQEVDYLLTFLNQVAFT
jgi:hypothetical protein